MTAKKPAKKATTRRKQVRRTAVTVEVEPADAGLAAVPDPKPTPKVVDAGPVQLRGPFDVGGPTHNAAPLGDLPPAAPVPVCEHPRAQRVNLGWGVKCTKCGHVVKP